MIRRTILLAALVLVALAFAAPAAMASGTLTVSKRGIGAGDTRLVVGDEAGTVTGSYTANTEDGPETVTAIDCGANCSAFIPDDVGCNPPTNPCPLPETVGLSKTAASGWSFVGWSGQCTGSAGCSVTFPTGGPNSRSVTATYQDDQNPTVSLVGPAAGRRNETLLAIGATATDNWGITRVDFLRGGVVVAADTNPADGYGFDYDISNVGQGQTVTLGVQSYDPSGRASGLVERTYTIDRQAGGTINGPAAGSHFQTAPAYTFSPDADASATNCQTLSGLAGSTVVHSETCGGNYTPQASSDGDYRVRVNFVDDVGNQGFAERSFKIDNGDPNLTINSPTAGQHVRSPFTPSSTATDGATAQVDIVLTCKLESDADFGPCNSLVAPDGNHTLSVRARDKAGNERTESVGFVADSSGPQIAITAGPADTAIVNSSSVTYTWTASDASPPLQQTCTIDGGAPIACGSPATASGLSEGSHTFTLRVTDALGNFSEVTRQVFVNAVRPSVEIVGGPAEGDVVNANHVAFRFSAAGGAVTCSLDSETAFRPCSGADSDTLSGLADGAHTFRVRARDETNDVVVRSRTFGVDTTKPTIPVTFTSSYAASKKQTVYSVLTLKNVPAGTSIKVTCKGRKCPVKKYSPKGSGSVKLKKFLKKKLRPGTTLEIRVTKDGFVGKVFSLKIRRGKPSSTTLCLAPGAAKPSKC